MSEDNLDEQLFNGYTIEEFLSRKEKEIIEIVMDYDDAIFLSMDVAKEIGDLIQAANLAFPTLDKSKTTVKIDSKPMNEKAIINEIKNSGGKTIYKNDLVIYNIPFNGNKDFLKIKNTKQNILPYEDILLLDSSIELTFNGSEKDIIGNDSSIMSVREAFDEAINEIDSHLKILNVRTEDYVIRLKSRLKNMLQALIERSELKSSSIIQLNPFV